MIMCASARGQAKGSAEGSLARVKRQKGPPVAPGQAAGTGGSWASIVTVCLEGCGCGFWRFGGNDNSCKFDNGPFGL